MILSLFLVLSISNFFQSRIFRKGKKESSVRDKKSLTQWTIALLGVVQNAQILQIDRRAGTIAWNQFGSTEFKMNIAFLIIENRKIWPQYLSVITIAQIIKMCVLW